MKLPAKSNWMLYPQGRVRARPYLIKKVDGIHRYFFATENPKTVGKKGSIRNNVLSLQKEMATKGESMSFRRDRNGGYWLSHILTGTYGRGPVRSIEDLMVGGWEIHDTIAPSEANGWRYIYLSKDGRQGVQNESS